MIHEQLVRGPLSELVRQFAAAPPRGEVTLVVAGATGPEPPALDVEAEVRRRLAAGQGPKEIAAALAVATGKPRRALYQLALALRPRT
jgi:16S rRNA (cytidine1402-2'-O)-methyltransferase